MSKLSFTAFCHPEPQGSSKAFVIGGKARITSANKKLKPFRSEVTRCAIDAAFDAGISLPMAGKHVPVTVLLEFYFARPASIPKRRTEMVVRPDCDKLIRAAGDALSGVAYYDDAQAVEIIARKHYGSPERVEVTVTTLEE
jgi:crossover junction endodeoxyribonuclease RusA